MERIFDVKGNTMKLLITGGLGHIGSYLIRNLEIKSGVEQITVVDSLQTQRYASLFMLPESPKIFFRDIAVGSLTSKDISAVGLPDCVIHLAATTDASGTVGQKDELFENNLGSTKHIIDICGDLGIPLIFPSSTSVYGSQSTLVDETCTDLVPQSPYAESKHLEEQAMQLATTKGLKGVVLRLGTIHGTSSGMRFHTAVNRFCYQAANGLPLTVWKTALHQLRPYLALEDASRAMAHVINNQMYDGEIYNVVTANHTVSQIIDAIEVETKKKCKVEFVENQIMNQLSYEVSSQKFQKTGFRFKGSLQRDIADTMNLLSGISNG
jgi:UDP-glucose 4-epimerase